MLKFFSYRYFLLFLFTAVCFTNSYAQDNRPRRIFARAYFGPVVSFYGSNKNHASRVRAGAGFNLGSRVQFVLDKRMSLLIGAEYFFHRLSFSSYYFSPGYDYLYDQDYNYRYTLLLNELHAPILLRFNSQGETKGHRSTYFHFGYVHRYLFQADLEVKSNSTGDVLYGGEPNPKFEYVIGANPHSAFVLFGAGYQLNRDRKTSALFFEINYKHSLSRFFIQQNFTPGNLFIRSYHVVLTIGLKI